MQYQAVKRPEGWAVRDTRKGQDLLGFYGKAAADRMARRLNEPAKLSAEGERLLMVLAVDGVWHGTEKYAQRLQRKGLISADMEGGWKITQWGKDWLGLTNA